ncbi:hypothetical protein [Streptomyces sp. FH025]|uniref:hypothetical protein n=1 Tax=Streptomyces sp. FH025 TaxID=2815937 RepID=UPI001A9E7C5D|nr:hypothetical protein [Streptomyces sp. FH025]MBO1416735.1 hypothetical protein [Streptomyces sp. FH025]
MAIRRKHVTRGWRAVVATLIGSVLVLAGAQSPAHAAETEWSSFDANQARVLSGVYSVTINGATYDVTEGTDHNIWFRYNGGRWNPLGGFNESRTSSPPRIVEFPPGRAMAVIRGLDGEIWYSQVNSGSANFWTSWTRLPSGARALGSPMVTVIPSAGALSIEVANANRQINTMSLWDRNGQISPNDHWAIEPYALLGTNATDIEGNSQIAIYGDAYYRAVNQTYFTGTDHHVWNMTLTPEYTILDLHEVDGGAECISGVGAARLGNQSTVVGPGQPGYAEQQRVLLSCIGNDGYVWETQSSDGGRTFNGWRHPAGMLAPSSSTPAVNPSNNSWSLNVRWNGARSTAFPDNAVVAKRIN